MRIVGFQAMGLIAVQAQQWMRSSSLNSMRNGKRFRNLTMVRSVSCIDPNSRFCAVDVNSMTMDQFCGYSLLTTFSRKCHESLFLSNACMFLLRHLNSNTGVCLLPIETIEPSFCRNCT